jgi:hypothetical protein
MKFLLVFLASVLLATGAAADESEPPSGTAALLCQRSTHGQTTSRTISIDYDNKLVDGTPATFSGSMIVWTVRNGSGEEHHELNRLTGTYNYWEKGQTAGEQMLTLVCTKTPIKF